MKFRHTALFAAFMATAPLAAASFSPAAASPKHDGAWNIQLVTDQGWCGAHEWQIGVRGGRVTDIGSPNATANGRIAPNGRVTLEIAKGEDVIQTTGVLSEAGGGGAWVLPNRSCTGRWVASRA
ncbi:MAG: hypothetical protein Q8M31_13665 [Beijerinckiaceae bacterium]|nr:hypothetical protein [Beijerinckiaceae bacterium]